MSIGQDARRPAVMEQDAPAPARPAAPATPLTRNAVARNQLANDVVTSGGLHQDCIELLHVGNRGVAGLQQRAAQRVCSHMQSQPALAAPSHTPATTAPLPRAHHDAKPLAGQARKGAIRCQLVGLAVQRHE